MGETEVMSEPEPAQPLQRGRWDFRDVQAPSWLGWLSGPIGTLVGVLVGYNLGSAIGGVFGLIIGVGVAAVVMVVAIAIVSVGLTAVLFAWRALTWRSHS